MLIVIERTVAARRPAFQICHLEEALHTAKETPGHHQHENANCVRQNQISEHELFDEFVLDARACCIGHPDPDIAHDVVNKHQWRVNQHEEPEPKCGFVEKVGDTDEDLDEEKVQVCYGEPREQGCIAHLSVIVWLDHCKQENSSRQKGNQLNSANH